MSVSISHPTDRPNFSRVEVGNLTVWFSYSTPIAFHTFDSGTVVRQNQWSNTTGKHLSQIDGGDKQAKEARVTGDEFEALLKRVTVSLHV